MQSLKEQLSSTQTGLASLQQQYSLSEKRLVRASKLISALGDEAGRWAATADSLTTRLQLLTGQPPPHSSHLHYQVLTWHIPFPGKTRVWGPLYILAFSANPHAKSLEA